ncbi:hypothetical protein SAMN05443579_102256 [Variovorax sp. PDC80]|nr:hypothetical protein SAMN05443579_102256 [Variovorax sp. PDC80]
MATYVTREDLAAPANLAAYGYDAEEAQSIFDNALPLQNYAELRAYTGRALGLRITSAGIAGTFQRDISDTTSADNGGTIILDASNRRWKRLFTGDVMVDWFGADNTGEVDSSSAVSVAAAYLMATRSGVGLGLGALVFGRGVYLCNGSIALGEARGLVIRGQGFGATELRRTVDTGAMFTQTLYSYLTFADMGINHAGALAKKGDWTTTWLDLSGSGIGQNLILKRLRVHGFNKQIDFGSRSLNGDTNYASECYFTNFNIFLEATNNQGIINNFSKCSFIGTVDSVLKVAGFGHTHFDTCNVVMSGKFLDLSGNGGPQSLYVADNCKFEHWPQGGAIGTTQLVVMNVATTAKVLFKGGGLAGGTPDPSVYQIVNRNSNGTIEFEGGNWAATIKMRHYKQVPTSVFGAQVFATYTKFKNCTISPSPANLVFDATGGTNQSYPGAVWQDCQDRPNICITGVANGQGFNAAVPAEAVLNRATFTGASVGGALLNGTTPVTFSMPHYGQPAFLRAVRVLIHSQAVVVNGTIKVFADAAKTIQIGSTIAMTGGASTTPKMYDLPIPVDTVVTDGVYVEMTNGNGIYAYGRVYIETMSI